jgi:hypothetical protein
VIVRIAASLTPSSSQSGLASTTGCASRSDTFRWAQFIHVQNERPKWRRLRVSKDTSGRCNDLLLYAEQLGIDLPWFARELAGAAHASRVRDDYRSGIKSGMTGTRVHNR